MAVLRLTNLAAMTLVALLVSAEPVRAADWSFDGVERVVAISDIHGAYEAMVRTLRSARVIDNDLAWSGGDTHLVVVGDLLDRGPNSRQAMDLLMRLENEAMAADGRVHVLLGNHEAMNLTGDLRYVSVGEYAAFAAEESAGEREQRFQAYQELRANNDVPIEEQRLKFDERFPPGFFAHRKAFASDGKYGSWLLSKPIMIVINDTAYVHGGVSPMIGEIGLQGVNERLHGELVSYVTQVEKLIDAELLLPTDSFYDHPKLLKAVTTMLTTDVDLAAAVTDVITLNESDVHAPNSPLWYRGNVACNEVIEADKLDASLHAVGAERVVIGHTPTDGRRILERLDGRVIEVDTGMLNNYYAGEGNALVIAGEQLTVINESGETWPSPAPHPRYVGQRPGEALGTEAIEKLLASGEVLATRDDASGRKIVSVSDGASKIDAVFAKRAGRNFYPEVAAYRLDLLLELGTVPVTVKRAIDGVEGSLQFLPAGVTDEVRRRETGRGGSAMCPLSDQWDAMLVFDALILNEGRFGTTIQYDQTTWQLLLVGHANAFGTSKGRPKHLAEVSLKIGRSWKEALAALTDDVLAERLGDVLDKRRMRALGERRDLLQQQGQ